MLEDDLHLLPVPQEERCNGTPKSLGQLMHDYSLLATVSATPPNEESYQQDTNRTLILKPNCTTRNEWLTLEARPILRGMFAWGVQQDGDILFQVYGGVPKTYTPPRKTLETTMGLFANKLVQAGYSLNPETNITYYTPTQTATADEGRKERHQLD